MLNIMTNSPETPTANPRWKDWYPSGVVPDFRNIPVEESPYGMPNLETLLLFASLPFGSRIGDIGGGDARYALPLARMGHQVIVTDVDRPPLVRANEKSRLHDVNRRMATILTDATTQFPIHDGSLDAVLNAGFGYLIPPDELDLLFEKMAATLKPRGAMVFECATNRDRRKTATSEISLIGENEYNYEHDEGMAVMERLYAEHGFRDFTIQEKTIHLEEPYYLHTDLIIASGIKDKLR